MSPAQDPDELLPVVDDQDRQVGLAYRSQVHGQGLLHRAVHVLLFDLDGNLWLQRRSQAKDTYPGMWTSSASGHLDPGEDYHAAAQRELREELGLDLELTYLGKVPAGPATQGEFSGVFRAQSGQKPVPDPEEIAEMGLFSLEDARALAADHTRAAPSLEAVMSQAGLI
ncbi:MAG: NUDIX domain-containing protein [Proteobacteria bacterium]|nr:NUDIX domain-containing protein [Pseudomonadota bacterium]MBU4576432.1 NUDIX domain-containing protein [Pseudomonadota bacterium]MBU4599095.1 NUDIX domain-containing protein [Pseudomonadota bacterium]MBV1714852.1 NUDIX domain-containing protein [Desulfarculus sp.]MBV1753132.1 NUDIX domain-containing protein [Desulfarculus sp.]